MTIITGHYGSGKTEFAVNLALTARKETADVTIADLDIVNPYFCTREKKETLLAAGISVISPTVACHHADVPAIPPEMLRIFERKEGVGIVDVGGDPNGARALGRFHTYLEQREFDLWLVVNANRPMTATPEAALAYLRAIETSCGQKITGIVNNTHLCGQTTVEEIEKGAVLCRELSRLSGLPLVCHTAEQRLLPMLSPMAEPVLPLEIQMKKPWE